MYTVVAPPIIVSESTVKKSPAISVVIKITVTVMFTVMIVKIIAGITEGTTWCGADNKCEDKRYSKTNLKTR
jgi:hypothetical protein